MNWQRQLAVEAQFRVWGLGLVGVSKDMARIGSLGLRVRSILCYWDSEYDLRNMCTRRGNGHPAETILKHPGPLKCCKA